MTIQDHFLAVTITGEAHSPSLRYYGVLTVDGANIESHRFADKRMAEEWLRIQVDAYQNA